MTIATSPFMKRAAQRGTTGHGNASEKRLAKSLGARLQPGSGALKSAKGDMKLQGTRKVLIEAKSTTALSMKLDQAWLTKINNEALSTGAIPALAISFVMPDGKKRQGTNEWICIPLHVFQDLLGE